MREGDISTCSNQNEKSIIYLIVSNYENVEVTETSIYRMPIGSIQKCDELVTDIFQEEE